MREDGTIVENITEIEDFNLRQSVRPGITGMAQLNAESDFHHRYKFKYDLMYIKKRNPAFVFETNCEKLLGCIQDPPLKKF